MKIDIENNSLNRTLRNKKSLKCLKIIMQLEMFLLMLFLT